MENKTDEEMIDETDWESDSDSQLVNAMYEVYLEETEAWHPCVVKDANEDMATIKLKDACLKGADKKWAQSSIIPFNYLRKIDNTLSLELKIGVQVEGFCEKSKGQPLGWYAAVIKQWKDP